MEFLQQNILWVAVALLSGLSLLWSLLRSSGGAGVSPVEATLLMNREDAVVLDIRAAEEYAAGHLPEARHIPLAKMTERLGELEKFKPRPVIVCCATGARSGSACRQLRAAGFARVHNLAGGIEAWRAANLPLKKGDR